MGHSGFWYVSLSFYIFLETFLLLLKLLCFAFCFQGRCNREKPPCKYFHPPQHLKDQLLINGRNHLALKNALLQQMGLTPGQPMVPGQIPAVVSAAFYPHWILCKVDSFWFILLLLLFFATSSSY